MMAFAMPMMGAMTPNIGCATQPNMERPVRMLMILVLDGMRFR